MVNNVQKSKIDKSHPKLPARHPVTGGRRQRRATETRLRIFRSALELYAERGFQSVTVEAITEAADVGKGTFFNYFASKEQVLAVFAEIQLGKVNEALQLAFAGNEPTEKVLRKLAKGLAQEPGRTPELARALISAFLANSAVRALMNRTMIEGRRLLAKLIAAAQKRDEVNSRLKAEAIAKQFQQTMMGTILFWSLHGEPSLEKCVEESFKYFWRSIVAAESQKS